MALLYIPMDPETPKTLKVVPEIKNNFQKKLLKIKKHLSLQLISMKASLFQR